MVNINIFGKLGFSVEENNGLRIYCSDSSFNIIPDFTRLNKSYKYNNITKKIKYSPGFLEYTKTTTNNLRQNYKINQICYRKQYKGILDIINKNIKEENISENPNEIPLLVSPVDFVAKFPLNLFSDLKIENSENCEHNPICANYTRNKEKTVGKAISLLFEKYKDENEISYFLKNLDDEYCIDLFLINQEELLSIKFVFKIKQTLSQNGSTFLIDGRDYKIICNKKKTFESISEVYCKCLLNLCNGILNEDPANFNLYETGENDIKAVECKENIIANIKGEFLHEKDGLNNKKYDEHQIMDDEDILSVGFSQAIYAIGIIMILLGIVMMFR